MIIKVKSSNETTKESYQATAREFADNVAELAPLASIEKFAKFLPPSAKIIDIGCGSGRDAKIFSERGFDVTGIDFCPSLIEIARSHAPLAQFHLMDIEKMDFPVNAFNGAWAACSLLHITKDALPAVLEKIHAMLKKDAYFYLTFKKGNLETVEQDVRYKGNVRKFWAYYQEHELKELLQLAEFKILDFATVEKTNPYQTHAAFRVFCQKTDDENV